MALGRLTESRTSSEDGSLSGDLAERMFLPKEESPAPYTPIVATREPPVTLLEQFEPERACVLLIGALKEGGREEMHKLLGLKFSHNEDGP